MTRAPRTLAVIDAGAATTSAALLGQIDRRWRLLGHLAVPAGVDEERLLEVLTSRITTAEPDLAAEIELSPAALDAMPRLESRSATPRTLAVLGATRRSVGLLEAAAARTAWRLETASTETHDPREMTELCLRADVSAVLVAAGDPPGPDEKASLDDLAGLVGASARRRPELQVIIGSSIRGRKAWTEGLGTDPPGDPARFVDAPALAGRKEPDDALRVVLDGLLADPLDGRQRLPAITASLADLLDRRVELFEIGHDAGARVVGGPGMAGDDEPSGHGVVTAQAALVPPDPDDAIVDQVLGWTIGSQDRHRMGDRLRDLRNLPWSDPTGEGGRLRLAAARAALARLVAVTPELSREPHADLTFALGGCFAAAPAAAVTLALADTVRRPGSTQVATDPARLLGPMATIEDPVERRTLLADVLDDVVVPLGSVVLAAGLSRGREHGTVGRLTLHHGAAQTQHDLASGELAFLELGPGEAAQATFEFRESARIGHRTRRVGVPVTGGLSGLLVDLRDVPLRLPDRRDRRRALLAAWTELAWGSDDR